MDSFISTKKELSTGIRNKNKIRSKEQEVRRKLLKTIISGFIPSKIEMVVI